MVWHPYSENSPRCIGLRSESGHGILRINAPTRPYSDDVTETSWVLITTPSHFRGALDLSCEAVAYGSGDHGLAAFLQELSDDFRGWEGERRWRAWENVELGAVNGGRGRVRLELRLTNSADPDSAVVIQPIEVEAGEALTRFSAHVAALFSTNDQ